MEWIDAMRGFTMILVVAYHVSMIGFGENPKDSAYLSTCLLFRMPLFFFISGFFSYSAKVEWSLSTLAKMTWKKFRIQVIPTAIFFCIALVMLQKNFCESAIEMLHRDTKGGYWFTIVLLQMFIFYYLFAYAESRVSRWLKARNLGWLPITIFWFAALCTYATWFMPAWFTYPKADFFKWSSLGQTIIYFHFFLAGNITHRYWPQIQRVFDAKWFVPTLLTVAVIALCEQFKWHNLRRQWANLPRTICMYSLMTIVILYFRHYAESFSKNTWLGRGLQYIGVRTLDIYLIHFLFIPHIRTIGPWLKTCRPNFAADILCSFAGALLVIGVSIIASNIIRISPFLKLHLFGRK